MGNPYSLANQLSPLSLSLGRGEEGRGGGEQGSRFACSCKSGMLAIFLVVCRDRFVLGESVPLLGWSESCVVTAGVTCL